MIQGRIRMNSASLQEKFPEIYQELFSHADIVTSAPGNFYWIGEYAIVFAGALGIKQNIPLRVYVGIEPDVVSTKIESFKYFVPSQKKRLR